MKLQDGPCYVVPPMEEEGCQMMLGKQVQHLQRTMRTSELVTSGASEDVIA